MDFEQDLRDQIMAELPHKPADIPALRSLHISELLIAYLNWRYRFIPKMPYRVHTSTVLNAKLPIQDSGQNAALKSIRTALAQGDDVTPHLSRGVKNGVVLTPPPKRPRKDMDLLVNHWGVHHLHLSTVIEADGFVTRTGPLLFVAIRKSDAYLLDIVDHGKGHPDAWTQQHILELMAAEWPNSDLVLCMGSAATTTPTLSLQALRKMHLNASFDYNGKRYMPYVGLTGSGVATLTTMRSIKLRRDLEEAEKQLAAKQGLIWEALIKGAPDLPSDAEFHFRILDPGHGVFEVKTGTLFRLSW